MDCLTSYDRAEAENRNVFTAIGELLAGVRNFAGTRHPNYGYLLISSSMTPEAIDGTGKQLGGYEFVEPADYDSVTALASCYLAFYFFNHSFVSPKKSWRLSFHPPPAIFTSHYKTIIREFPEKQLGT
jgi:hypothetical protein